MVDSRDWIKERMDRELELHGSAPTVIAEMSLGLCILVCCVEPDSYSKYKRSFEQWITDHQESPA